MPLPLLVAGASAAASGAAGAWKRWITGSACPRKTNELLAEVACEDGYDPRVRAAEYSEVREATSRKCK